MILLTLLCIHLAAISPMIVAANIYDVTKYGADPKGKEKIDAALKKAINAATSNGGGTIYFPRGHYITGPMELTSNIHLHFADRVFVTWSNDSNDYPAIEMQRSEATQTFDHAPLIYSNSASNISITGKATLDGQGSVWWEQKEKSQELSTCGLSMRKPVFMHFFNSKNILLKDITVQNSPMWNVNPYLCENVTIKNIKVINPVKSHNTDGINIYSCKNLHISNVTISTGDDCVILKSCKNHPTQNVFITDSHMKEGHCGVGIGSVISGGLNNITITNCIFDGTDRGLYIKSARGRGGLVENIHYTNNTLKNVTKEGVVLSMLYDGSNQDFELHNRNIQWEQFNDDTPVYRNIQYNSVTGSTIKNPVFFVGLPESPISNIKLSDIKVKSTQQIFLNNTKSIEINGKMQPDHYIKHVN